MDGTHVWMKRVGFLGLKTHLAGGLWDQWVYPTTFVMQVGISPFHMGVERLWEALFVVSQKWIPFPTALKLNGEALIFVPTILLLLKCDLFALIP